MGYELGRLNVEEVSPHLHGGRMEKPLRKNHHPVHLDLPILGSLAQYETSTLADYAIVAGLRRLCNPKPALSIKMSFLLQP
uniref:Uncharacterized protein n=1 Tax=Timema shepardi TaxID=629360 RepID=A0A7R9B8A3_TIMSH|nr:unnamed protein product [Timema shepardi]